MGLAVGSSIPLVAQPTDYTCWAASMAMLLGTTAEDVCTQTGMSLTEGYGWDQIRNAVSHYGLTEIGPACGGPDFFAQYVQYGPLWIVEVGAPYHAVVLTGLYTESDTWDADTTRVTVNNPWPPGSGAVEDKPFMDLERDFELGAGARAQMVQR